MRSHLAPTLVAELLFAIQAPFFHGLAVGQYVCLGQLLYLIAFLISTFGKSSRIDLSQNRK
jgi:hypothetical protein